MRRLNHEILLGGIILALGLASALGQVETPTPTPPPTATPAPTPKINYAAIAYHKATNSWGYSTEKATQEEATAEALRKCGHPDAKTNWCRNSWIALAVSSTHGWGSAWAVTPQDARKKSIEQCFAHQNNPDAHIVICVHSDGRIDTVTNSH
jgi:Domain of unknown function (DUF4189)